MLKKVAFLSMFGILFFAFWRSGRANTIQVLHYEDTGAVAIGDVDLDYWYAPNEVVVGSLIDNGDFQSWTEGQPDYWTFWADSKAGWEEAHLAQMDYAIRPEGENDAFGIFVRNVGGDGAYYAGAWQPLSRITAPGYYWVTTHFTMWGEHNDIHYNSVAWYGIGNSADPAGVSDWHELSPLPFPCPNILGVCLHIGRYETIYLEPGQYFHLRVGHNFPTYNVWTVFGIDDISIIPASGAVIEDGFWPDGLVTWNPHTLR